MKNLFTSNGFFLLATVVSTVGSIVYTLTKSFINSTGMFLNVYLLLSTICVITLYVSYQKHAKNIMKGIMGSLLMVQLISAIDCCKNIESNFDIIFAPIYLVLMILLFVNHFVINSTHHATPRAIMFNQLLALLLVITNTIWSIFWIGESIFLLDYISGILGTLCYIGYILTIVCVESRLDAYKEIRDRKLNN